MSTQLFDTEATAGACAYILHILLQRLDDSRPGLVLDMLEGVRGDCAAIEANGAMTESIRKRCQAAEHMLELIHAQNQMASSNRQK